VLNHTDHGLPARRHVNVFDRYLLLAHDDVWSAEGLPRLAKCVERAAG
jgi:hypothetical protein